MKIALFGATGAIGQRIAQEALRRGHTVTAVVRDPAALTERHENLRVVRGDVTNPDAIADAVRGQDAVISAVGPRYGHGGETDALFADAARALIAALPAAGVSRLLILGGAGSLEAAPGVRVMDTPEFPALWKGNARGQADALDVYRTGGGDLEWTYVSPAAIIEPGARTGKYRVGGEQLLTDAQGQSRISSEDYAVALIDELENPRHRKQRITVAY
jgi:putative NADH-flavin reductase